MLSFKSSSDFVFLLFAFGLIFGELSLIAASEEYKKALMIRELEVIRGLYEVGYAPLDWKKECFGFDLSKEFEAAKEKVIVSPSLSTKQFQILVKETLAKMQDHHVHVGFIATEQASLPISIRGAEGRYFIDWIDPLYMPQSRILLSQGDEVLEFNGESIGSVIDVLKNEIGPSSNEKTRQRLSEMKLTLRLAKAGDVVPKGSAKIKCISAKSGRMYSHQLRWNYSQERIRSPFESLLLSSSLRSKTNQKDSFCFSKNGLFSMYSPLYEEYAHFSKERAGSLGSFKSFLPYLGEVVWTNEKLREENNPFYAYIYQLKCGKSVGYVRIPHYLFNDGESRFFEEIVKKLEKETSALVIDQLHNHGGFVHFLYEIASMLTENTLETPHHRIKIASKDVYFAWETLDFIEKCEREIEKGFISENQEEFHWTHQELLVLKSWCEAILEDWNEGVTLSRLTPIAATDHINPHPRSRYTKPILMLIDEMDFSCADLMPAIMQDNKRARLFGGGTAGAGGYVKKYEFLSSFGIAFCTYTASMAHRLNKGVIENKGVLPDREYELVASDVALGYRQYVDAVNDEITDLINNHGAVP